MQYNVFETEWGSFGVVVCGKRIVATFLPGPGARIRRWITAQWPDALEAADPLPRFRRQVVDYFAGKPVKFTAEMDLSGVPPFRQQVLTRCRRIRYGKTASYGDLARAAGKPGAARAVGGAMANNPLPLVVPCHRVLCSDGSIGGFSSPEGVRLKKRMLALENTLRDGQPGEDRSGKGQAVSKRRNSRCMC